jgi:predicted amidohydrolase YtcJ
MAARLTAYVVVGIVAATLIAGLIAQRDDSDGPVDLIVHNANVYTADDGEVAEAVAIRGNQILRVGSDRDVTRLRRPQTTVIDAKGGTVLPGFTDAHAHVVDGGLSLSRVDLTGVATVEDAQQRIRAWVETHPDAVWVLGGGWSATTLSVTPTRQQLDAIVPDKPVEILSADGGSSWVNSRALRLGAITRMTPSPEGGTIVKDARSGEPTGVLRGAATAMVSKLVPQASREDRAHALRAAIAEAHRLGITSVQEAAATPEAFELFADARRAGDLTLRVYASRMLPGLMDEAQIGSLDALAVSYPDDPLFKAGAVTIGLDGPIDTQAAAMLEPYADRESSGATAIAPDDFNKMVRLLDARGWQVITAATGDRAVRMALNAYEHAVRSNSAPSRGRRHRIEHAAIVDETDLPRFGALGVLASLQPGAVAFGADRLDFLTTTLGPARAARAWSFGSLARARARIAFGSDWPFAPLDPIAGLHAAVTRGGGDDQPEGAATPADRLTLAAALDAYTADAAWASFDEQRKGTVAAGMLADLVLLSDNILDAPPSRLATTRVAMTIFDGKIVYRRDANTTN